MEKRKSDELLRTILRDVSTESFKPGHGAT
jgi:hypothetical protein